MAVLWSWVGSVQPCQDMPLLIRRLLWLFYLFTLPYYCTLFRHCFSHHPAQGIFSISAADFVSTRHKLVLSYVPVLSATKKPSPSSFSGGHCIINRLFYVHKTHGLLLKISLSECPGCLWDTWPWCIPGLCRASVPAAPGSSCSRVLRMLGLSPGLILAGTRQREGPSALWVMRLELSRVQSPGDGRCLVFISLRSKISPVSPAQGFAG